MQFFNKTAIIIGGASGMGLLTGQKLAEEGANVVLVDVDEERLLREAESIRASGGNAAALTADIRDFRQVDKAVQYAKDRFGGVDITVCYAGGCASRVRGEFKAFPELSLEALDWGIDVNFRGPLYLARAVFGIMAEQKRGVIINIGSIDGVTGSFSADYSAEKSGLIGFTKSLALLGAPHGVRSCCVSPGPVLTRPQMANMKTPLGRAAEPWEVVELVLYLCSDKASFITGDNYMIDGGRSCGAKD